MIKVPYLLQAPVKGVKLLDGRFLRAFNNNIAFLKRFDIDRMLYWFREMPACQPLAPLMPPEMDTLKTICTDKLWANF